MPNYKLMYFDIRARGELPRLLFTYAGVKFEDYRVKDWGKEKADTPMGQVPVLFIDGVPHSESVAICNLLAREFGLYGKSKQEMFEVDQVVGVTQDIWRVTVDLIHAKDNPAEIEKLKKLNEEQFYPQFVGKLEILLKKNGTGYFVGNEITYADIAAYDCVDLFVPKSIIDSNPLFKANIEKVRTAKNLKDYIANRKNSVI